MFGLQGLGLDLLVLEDGGRGGARKAAAKKQLFQVFNFNYIFSCNQNNFSTGYMSNFM